MNCDGVRELLSAYVDGELLPGELLRVEQHLRRCPACVDEVDSLRQTVALVASLDEVEVPASFHAGLHERLVALGSPSASRLAVGDRSRQKGVRRWMLPAAAAAAALTIGITSYGQVGQLALNRPAVSAPKGPQVAENVPVAASEPAQSQPAVASATDAGTQKSSGDVTPANQPNPSTPPMTTTAGPGQKEQVEPPTPAAPGKTTNLGGAAVATVDPGKPSAPVQLTPVYHYVATATFPAASAAAVRAVIKAPFPDAKEVNGTIMIEVPASSYKADLTVIKGLAPGATVDESQTTDLAGQIQDAKDRVTSLQEEQAKLDKNADTDQDTKAVQHQALDAHIAEAQASLNALYLMRDRAVITIQFKPAAQ